MNEKTLTHAVILPVEGRTVIQDGMIVIRDTVSLMSGRWIPAGPPGRRYHAQESS